MLNCAEERSILVLKFSVKVVVYVYDRMLISLVEFQNERRLSVRLALFSYTQAGKVSQTNLMAGLTTCSLLQV